MSKDDRKVYLPLEKLDSCGKCATSARPSELKLCGGCKEAAYCSESCQQSDWATHKAVCGGKKNNDHIDLGTFYPILSQLSDANRVPMNGEELHPALTHKIVAPPKPFTLPDGTVAKIIELGPMLDRPSDLGTEQWWSTAHGAPSASGRKKLAKRIITEGQVLPVCYGLALSLMATIYTTNFDKQSGSRRARLVYKSSPISDFGIAHGKFDAPAQDRLAYFDGENMIRGQDHEDHYWLWFRTARGEEVIFDGSVYTFNFCTMNPGDPYCVGVERGLLPPGWEGALSPGYFFNRELSRDTAVPLHTERKRMSVLRNPRLQRAIRLLYASVIPYDVEDATVKVYYPDDMKAIREEFRQFASNATLAEFYKDPLMLIVNDYRVLDDVLRRKAWKKWPQEALMGIDMDPGEDKNFENAEVHRKIQKWNKRFKKGLLTREEYNRGARKIIDS